MKMSRSWCVSVPEPLGNALFSQIPSAAARYFGAAASGLWQAVRTERYSQGANAHGCNLIYVRRPGLNPVASARACTGLNLVRHTAISVAVVA